MAPKLPDFLIIGAPKAATSWLARNLRQHEGVFLAASEIHYFNRGYAQGLDWYAAHFDEAKSGKRIGEKSATYLASPEVPERVAQLLPNVRLIAQLRNPIDRAYSDYCMLLRRGTVTHRIDNYLDPARAAGLRFIADGEYARHLSRWLSFFPREQILIHFYDEIRQQPIDVLGDVTAFLQLRPINAPEGARPVDVKEEPRLPLSLRRALAPLRHTVEPLRRTEWFRSIHARLARPFEYPPLTNQIRSKLRDYYSADIANLEKILGRNVPQWLDASASPKE
jgi:hypothetical protein